MSNQGNNDMRDKLFTHTPLYPPGTDTSNLMQYPARSPERTAIANNLATLQKSQTFGLYPGGGVSNNNNNNNNNNSNNTLRPANTMNYTHSLSPQSYQLSPQRPLSPQPSRSVYNDQLEQLSSYPLSSVINHVHLKQALENILIEIISERKDSDNSLKRLWIFQHLIETPCSKCCFIRDEEPEDQPKNRFRIKSKCLSSHFRVSGNTPFNWLSRDFIRVHAPHSSGVPERKDLREIYYDGFGLFREDMKVQDFIQLSKQLAGRPTSKKRKNRPDSSSGGLLDSSGGGSGGSGNSGSGNGGSGNGSSQHGGSLTKLKKIDNDGKEDDDATIVLRSRLILSLKVANRSQIIMYSDRINLFLNKSRSPIELPTFRPEQSIKYEIGRREKKEEDEEQRNPFKIYIEDISISRNHLLILFSPDGWTITDVGSSLGTLHSRTHRENFSISHNKLERNVPFRLEEGDVLTLSEGNASFTVLSCKFFPDDYFLVNQFHS